MKNLDSTKEQRLGVCAWSLQPQSAAHLRLLLEDIGIRCFQSDLDQIRNHPDRWDRLPEFCATHGLTMVSGMFRTAGEDYSSLESIRKTGGIVPDETWEENWYNIQANALLAEQLGINLVTFHAGFIPHDKSDPGYAKIIDRIKKIALAFAEHGINLGLETGQETAETLRSFLEDLDCSNVGVNFDPANMIMYNMGDPIQAIKTLGPWIFQCHIKDAKFPEKPGQWGEEVPVGSGDVNWPEFFKMLKQIDYHNDFLIEREAGNDRLYDIQTAVKVVSPFIGS